MKHEIELVMVDGTNSIARNLASDRPSNNETHQVCWKFVNRLSQEEHEWIVQMVQQSNATVYCIEFVVYVCMGDYAKTLFTHPDWEVTNYFIQPK